MLTTADPVCSFCNMRLQIIKTALDGRTVELFKRRRRPSQFLSANNVIAQLGNAGDAARKDAGGLKCKKIVTFREMFRELDVNPQGSMLDGLNAAANTAERYSKRLVSDTCSR